jgi:hypothetical protein
MVMVQVEILTVVDNIEMISLSNKKQVLKNKVGLCALEIL